MEEELGGPMLSTRHFMDVSCNMSDLSVGASSISRGEIETTTDANDVLQNGIIIETSKGLEWLSLTDALTSGVGGLNLSVEDFHNVAAQLLHSRTTAVRKNVPSSTLNLSNLEKNVLMSADNLKSIQCFSRINSKLESISEAGENLEEAKVEVFKPASISKGLNVLPNDKNLLKKKIKILSSSDSSLTVSESTGTNSDSSVHSAPPIQQVKRKGGWPKGRKRKPELANRPPKAPCTGYVYYLNEKRKLPEFRKLPFPEVTKILGNEWSNLSLENKKEYLEKAEVDKKRYREELKVYRNSETYKSYLKRRRIKSCKTNGTEESDVTDATDEIDDEDNEELYCRSCDQWFTTLHNKKEHLYGKQHFQAISQNASNSFSLDESSLDGTSHKKSRAAANPDLPSIPDAMAHFFSNVAEREREIRILREREKSLVARNMKISKGLQELKQAQVKLQNISSRLKAEHESIERAICDLLEVPALFSVEVCES
ncbi:uncharacterized protein LOC128988311 [Macrosteles quadrilineatus]|uniref:uncharacterized protein LOC128988311 n=1 Tax=Macrosteles quadrilineatus TaxID=74068 RepID=UPI0023E24EF7|nr:uncharacterized protein LOC128988311 [Macrosteles quadrilineatus]